VWESLSPEERQRFLNETEHHPTPSTILPSPESAKLQVLGKNRSWLCGFRLDGDEASVVRPWAYHLRHDEPRSGGPSKARQ